MLTKDSESGCSHLTLLLQDGAPHIEVTLANIHDAVETFAFAKPVGRHEIQELAAAFVRCFYDGLVNYTPEQLHNLGGVLGFEESRRGYLENDKVSARAKGCRKVSNN